MRGTGSKKEESTLAATGPGFDVERDIAVGTARSGWPPKCETAVGGDVDRDAAEELISESDTIVTILVQHIEISLL